MYVPVVVVEEWPLLSPVLRVSTFAAVPLPIPIPVPVLYAELVSKGACVDPAEDREAGWLTVLFCAIFVMNMNDNRTYTSKKLEGFKENERK